MSVSVNAPFVEELVPSPDPVRCCERLEGLPYRLFLDSAAVGTRLGRYSFLTADPVAVVRSKGELTECLDLGAGTGKLARSLVATGAHVIALEPGDEMRAQLERAVPEADAIAAGAELIPLPDDSVVREKCPPLSMAAIARPCQSLSIARRSRSSSKGASMASARFSF